MVGEGVGSEGGRRGRFPGAYVGGEVGKGEDEVAGADGGDQSFVDEVLSGSRQALSGAAEGPGDVGAGDGAVPEGGEGCDVGLFWPFTTTL